MTVFAVLNKNFASLTIRLNDEVGLFGSMLILSYIFFSVLSFLFILPSAFLHALFINNKLREPLNVYQTTFRDVVLRNVNKSAEEFNL